MPGWVSPRQKHAIHRRYNVAERFELSSLNSCPFLFSLHATAVLMFKHDSSV